MGFDITKYKKRYYEFTVSESEKINLKVPTLQLAKKVPDQIKNLGTDVLTTEELQMIYEMVKEILNNNKENKEFTLEFVSELFEDYLILMDFLEDYSTWIYDNINQKN